MKFSESWLREWVNPSISRDELSEKITMAGLEVDGIEAVASSFNGVVIGEVVECGQHPDADKLRVTKINVGGDELLDIVCGAPNCRQGLKVAVAQVGAVLPGDFKIKKAKLRGQPSHGMLCAYSELGISDESDGIMELPSDAPIGTDLRDYLQLDDVTIEVDLTPNRADCLSLRGLAREVGVLNQMDVAEPQWQNAVVSIEDTFTVNVEATEQCPRYLGRVIKGVDVKATTPLWMQERLRRSGIRSIDPVVDVTNYVLVEQGQPMHAFDLAKLNGSIDVRLANNGEKLVLLDGNEVELKDNTLTICDQSGPIAMAGIFGGEKTGVTESSSDIFLECAFFSKLAITGRARQYGLHTDSSHRYERGVDFQLQTQAMERATQLLVEICGGEVGPIVESGDEAKLPQAATITLRHARLEKVIGYSFAKDQVSEILTRLGMTVTETEQGWQATAPSYRFDMAIEEDLIEEVARIFGYNNIPNVSPVASLKMSQHKEVELPASKLRQLLCGRGYQEAVTYSFVDPKRQQLLHPQQDAMILPHPISVEMSAMRLSLWTGLLDTVSYNQKRQQARVRVFESGLRFVPDTNAENNVSQTAMLAGVISGTANQEAWNSTERELDFFDIKGDVEALIQQTTDADSFSFEAANIPALHPGQSASILRHGKHVGYVGALHPQHLKAFGLSGKVFVFELELAAVTQRNLPDAKPVSKFPANRRDLALLVSEQVNAGDLLNCIKKVGGNQLVGVNLFDVYKGKGIADDMQSIAISLTLQEQSRTLEEKEIAATVDTIVEALRSEFDASLRD
ncbi:MULTISPECIES: phenylalanine--tRNA ligase subunit beta [unclassified Agarivorans]|uniref:phenylalanine--tRNA ligase subunit beta n=1 Tax=unclassified Agarivorans TaxID=2636026 RepID=UPI0026E13482|nr:MULTISPECIES: phenylalanine--tRNA ligase subunit beta [unclassified Agarivorans]MDO6685918.1 phenylalanine--tRNA ligase subunit beta [Agarivorans sp. 3_MG-2023]MDO6713944.1 phenylalanine--tRNA ligase subunit beta [Agarivorans sp. 2_MG-2023]